MLSANNEDNIPKKSLQIMKQDDRFFSKLISKENSRVNSSRVYYGGASGAIPFMWESQPGTPKHTLFSDSTLPPPLTPPPFHSTCKSKSLQKTNHLKQNIFANISPLRLITSKKKKNKNNVSSSFSWSSSSSSSSSWSWSSSYPSPSSASGKIQNRRRRSISCTSRSPINNFGINDDDEEEKDHGSSSTTTLCFGGNHKSLKGSRGCSFSMVNMKNSLLSIVGYGSGHSPA